MDVKKIKPDGTKVYEIWGPLFFGSVQNFNAKFDVKNDPKKIEIDFIESRVSDHSAIEAIFNLVEKYETAGKKIVLKHLSEDCKVLLYKANEKFQTIIETLDGASPTPGVLDKFELAGCYIANISYGDMAYASSEQVQVTVGIRYDNAEIFDAAGNATLTGADLDQTVSNATGGGTVA